MKQPTVTADQLEPIDMAFVLFCYGERTEAPVGLLGQPVIDLIMSGVDRSSIRKPFGTREMAGVSLLPIAVYAAPLLPAGPLAIMAPLPLALVASWLFFPSVNSVCIWRQTRGEANYSELVSCASDTGQRRYVRALEEYRDWLAHTSDQLFIRSSNGTLRPITEEEQRAIHADHGRQLLLSSDRSGWPKVRSRPLPDGELMVCLRGRRAKSLLTSMRLMLEQDDEGFETAQNDASLCAPACGAMGLDGRILGLSSRSLDPYSSAGSWPISGTPISSRWPPQRQQ